VIIELPHAGNVRMVGNLLGDPMQAVAIGADVEGVLSVIWKRIRNIPCCSGGLSDRINWNGIIWSAERWSPLKP
jgi:hypothetical protein